jgi:hypothetical protein
MKTNELNHKLYLYRPSGEASDFLGELLVDNLNVDIKLHDISSISFTIPRVINGVPNTRIDQLLDNYIVELHYGRIDETYPDDYFKMRFVIYKTPSEFSDSKFIHSYQGSSTESLLEFKLINNWPGVEVYDFFRTISYNRASNNFIEGSLVATLATGTNVVTLTTGTTSGLIAGQILTKISGDGVFGTDARVGAITNPTQFTVVNSSGTALNHATLGAITFSATTYVNQESNATTGQRYIRLAPVRPGGVDTVYPLDIFLYEIRKKIVVGEEIETKNALIQFDYAGKTYTHADFKVGYYYLSLNGDGTVEYIYIALPDNDVTYNTSTNNYLYNTFTSDYTFSYRLYDNPITKTYAVGPNSTDEANPLNNMYITLATDADQGDLTPEYGTPQISYNSQKIYSKNGLTLRQILTGKTLESADTPNRDGLLYDTGYTIGTIHADIQDLYRSNLQFNNITRLQAIKQVAESFKAFIVFDTITKTMSFYPENAYGTNKGLILRYASYLKSLNKEVDSSKIITLATAIGKDKTTLNLINPTGKSYWEDYAYFLDSYFINTDDNDILTLISGGNLTLTIESKRLKTDSRINTSITHNALKVLYTGSTGNFTNRWFSTTAHAKVLGEWQFARDLYHEIMLGNIEPDTDLDVSLGFLQRYYDLYTLRDEEIKNYVKLETQLAEYEASMYKSKYLYEYYKKEWDELTATQQTTAISNGSQTWLRYNKYRLEFTAKTIELEAFKISILNPIKDELFGTTANPEGAADSVLRKLLEVQSALHRQSTATDSSLTTCLYVINPIESLNDFKRNAVNNDSSIDNELELLKSTKIYLNENKYPKITVNLDTASLISAEEARQDWNKSFVGDKLYVFLPELNVDLEVQVREVSIDFESNSMSLTISNVRNYNRTFGRFLTKIVRNLYNANQNITTFYQDQYNEGSKRASEDVAAKKIGQRFEPKNKSTAGAQDVDTGKSSVEVTGAGIEMASVDSVDEATQTFTLIDKAEKGLSQVDGSLVAYYDRGAGGIRTEVEISGDNGIIIKKIDNTTNVTNKQMYIDTNGNAVFNGQLIVGGQPTPIDVFRSQILVGVAYSIEDLQNQIDGVINTWFGDEDPTLLNYPTQGWNPAEYSQYVGDLFYNTVSGEAFRFVYTVNLPEDPTDYSWIVIADNDVTLALSNAAAAQATADTKVTIFYAANQDALDDITPPSGSGAQLAEDGDMVIIATNFTHSVTSIAYKQFDTFRWDDTLDLWVKTQNIYDKAEGSVGGWTVGGTTIYSNNTNVVLNNAGWIGLKKDSYASTTAGAFLGIDTTDSNKAKFNVGSATRYFKFDGTDVVMSGNLSIGQTTIGYTNSGIFLGFNGSTPVLSLVPTSGANQLTWNGSALSVTGTVNANAGNFTSTVTIGSGSTTGTLKVGTNATAISLVGTNSTTSTAIYSGTTGFGTGTGFYMDASGRFSLADKLSWNGSALSVVGDIGGTIGNITVGNIVINNTGITTTTNKFSVNATTGLLTAVDGNFSGTITASAGAIGPWGINSTGLTLNNASYSVNFSPSEYYIYDITKKARVSIEGAFGERFLGTENQTSIQIEKLNASMTYETMLSIDDYSVRKYGQGDQSILLFESYALNSSFEITSTNTINYGTPSFTRTFSTSSTVSTNGNFIVGTNVVLIDRNNNSHRMYGSITARTGTTTITHTVTITKVINPTNKASNSSWLIKNLDEGTNTSALLRLMNGNAYIAATEGINLLTIANKNIDMIVSGTGKVRWSIDGGSSMNNAQNGTGFGTVYSSKIIKKDITSLNENDIQDFIDKIEIKQFKYKENNKLGISLIIEDEIDKNIPLQNVLFKRDESAGTIFTSLNAIPEHLKEYLGTDNFIHNEQAGEYIFAPMAYDIAVMTSINTAIIKKQNNDIKKLKEENEILKQQITLIKATLGIS